MGIPNLFIPGAPKSGTTSLYFWLSQHPQIYFPSIKEPHFFAEDLNIRIIIDKKSYFDLYKINSSSNIKYLGDASTFYLYSKVAIKKIETSIPNPLYIVCLRNPVDLVYSFYLQQLFDGNEHIENFWKAWLLSPKRRKGEYIRRITTDSKTLDYQSIGKLGEQVERLLSIVDRKRVFFVFLDELVKDVEQIYKNILKFLGLKYHKIDFKKYNVAKEPRSKFLMSLIKTAGFIRKKIPIKTQIFEFKLYQYLKNLNKKELKKKELDINIRKKLVKFYYEDILLLSKLTERDLSNWLKIT